MKPVQYLDGNTPVINSPKRESFLTNKFADDGIAMGESLFAGILKINTPIETNSAEVLEIDGNVNIKSESDLIVTGNHLHLSRVVIGENNQPILSDKISNILNADSDNNKDVGTLFPINTQITDGKTTPSDVDFETTEDITDQFNIVQLSVPSIAEIIDITLPDKPKNIDSELSKIDNLPKTTEFNSNSKSASTPFEALKNKINKLDNISIDFAKSILNNINGNNNLSANEKLELKSNIISKIPISIASELGTDFLTNESDESINIEDLKLPESADKNINTKNSSNIDSLKLVENVNSKAIKLPESVDKNVILNNGESKIGNAKPEISVKGEETSAKKDVALDNSKTGTTNSDKNNIPKTIIASNLKTEIAGNSKTDANLVGYNANRSESDNVRIDLTASKLVDSIKQTGTSNIGLNHSELSIKGIKSVDLKADIPNYNKNEIKELKIELAKGIKSNTDSKETEKATANDSPKIDQSKSEFVVNKDINKNQIPRKIEMTSNFGLSYKAVPINSKITIADNPIISTKNEFNNVKSDLKTDISNVDKIVDSEKPESIELNPKFINKEISLKSTNSRDDRIVIKTDNTIAPKVDIISPKISGKPTIEQVALPKNGSVPEKIELQPSELIRKSKKNVEENVSEKYGKSVPKNSNVDFIPKNEEKVNEVRKSPTIKSISEDSVKSTKSNEISENQTITNTKSNTKNESVGQNASVEKLPKNDKQENSMLVQKPAQIENAKDRQQSIVVTAIKSTNTKVELPTSKPDLTTSFDNLTKIEKNVLNGNYKQDIPKFANLRQDIKGNNDFKLSKDDIPELSAKESISKLVTNYANKITEKNSELNLAKPEINNNIEHNDKNFRQSTNTEHKSNGDNQPDYQNTNSKNDKNKQFDKEVEEKNDFVRTIESIAQKSPIKADRAKLQQSMPKYMTFSKVKPENIPNIVTEIITGSGNNYSGTAKLILNPKTLGTIFVEITTSDDTVRLNIKAENPETVKALENTINNLRDRIEQNGIKIENLNINHYTGEQKKDASAQRDKKSDNGRRNKKSDFDMEKILKEGESAERPRESNKRVYQRGNYIEQYI